MYPLHDKDLDLLSREAAEHYKVESGASGWEHLERRLDQELPNKKDRRRFLFWIFLISLITGGCLTVVLLNNSQPLISFAPKTATSSKSAENGQVTTNSHQPTTGSNKSTISTDEIETTQSLPITSNKEGNASSTIPRTAPQQATEPATIQNSKATQQPNVQSAQKVTPNGTISGKPLSLNNPSAPTGTQNNSNLKKSPNKNRSTIVPGNVMKHIVVTDNPDDQLYTNSSNEISQSPKKQTGTISETTGTTQKPVNNDNDFVQDNTSEALADKPSNVVTNVQPDIKKTAAPKVTDSSQTAAPVVKNGKEAASKKNTTIKQPLELGLMAGPDATTVEFGPLYQLGINAGLQIGYRFSNHWSVNTGIIYTKKFYKADGQYYHGKLPWPGITVDEVKGNCSMLDIPVNARYDVTFNAKRRFFVSAGLSTYLMNKENYNISYYYNNQYRQYPKNIDSNSNYVFSIANFSVGYERSLSRHFSIQAEPYLKIPMKGLGYGKMRMDSYGIFFSLKYKPEFRSKKHIR